MEVIKEVLWSERATEDLRRIFYFTRELHDFERASAVVNNLIDSTESSLLGQFDVGAKDQAFSHLGDFKKLFHGIHKITFISDGSTVNIVRVFDMRQHPDRNK